MRIFIMDCGGVLGVPFIRWLLEHSDASIVGSDRYHERLDELLSLPRFTYYAFDEEDDPRLLDQLVANADVVVDLSSVEQRDGHEDSIADLQRKLSQHTALLQRCVSHKKRLIHVSSADIYQLAEPGTPGRSDVSQPVDEDEATLIVEPADSLGNSRQNSERMVQQLIHAYGASDGLDYVVVRLFDTFNADLDTLPIRSARPLLAQVRDVMSHGGGSVSPVAPDDYLMRTFVYAEDAADCLGRIVLDESGRCAQEVINIGNPANTESTLGIARRVLTRYDERTGSSFSRSLALGSSGVQGRQLRLPSVRKAQELVGWAPGWSLDRAITAVLDHLLAAYSNGQPVDR